MKGVEVEALEKAARKKSVSRKQSSETSKPNTKTSTSSPTAALTASFPPKVEADAFIEPASAALNQLAPDSGLASLREMLLQGLVSKDSDLLERSLSVQEPALVKGALLALPDAQVLPLLGELIGRLQRKPRRAPLLLPWLRQVLLLKSTLLMTSEEGVEEVLRPLFGLIEARTRTHKRMVQLKGRLDFILSQAEEAKRNHPLIPADQVNMLMTTPMATFDESSDEDEDASDTDEIDEMSIDAADDDSDSGMQIDEEDREDDSEVDNSEDSDNE